MTSEPTPALIEVTGSFEEELAAHAADLHFSVAGSSLVTGRAVLTKAREVAVIVEALGALGLAESALSVESVRAEVKSGLLGKSSSASYALKLHVTELDQLPAALGAITAAKNVSLERLEWRYPSDAATEGRMLAEASLRARAKASAVASALGVGLGALQEALELGGGVSPHEVTHFGAPQMMRARSAAEPLEMGLELQHKLTVRREVRLKYRVLGA